MNERVAPQPDLYATCPLDGGVLDYYKGTFEAVYVLLHPLIRPITISKSSFKPETYPDRKVIIDNCEAVRWASVISLTELPSIAAIDIGLRTQIGGLNKEFANKAYATRLNALFDTDGIVPPADGQFSDLLHDHVLQFFQELGHGWTWVGDEHCTERRLYWIDDLKGKDRNATARNCNVFAPDNSLLWTTHWDSHFSFLCGSRATLARVEQHNNFEGFFCDSSTEVFWSVHET